MSIRVNDPAMSHLPDEKSVTVGDKEGRICIHPWERHETGLMNRDRVAVTLGELKKDGTPKDGGDEGLWNISIFDRADFVEALLAVFPELQRADAVRTRRRTGIDYTDVAAFTNEDNDTYPARHVPWSAIVAAVEQMPVDDQTGMWTLSCLED